MVFFCRRTPAVKKLVLVAALSQKSFLSAR
jgi:hypothetical protein